MATNTSTAVCPPYTQMPALSTLPIPHDINAVAVHGNDTSFRPMAFCCEPKPVQVVASCYLWCEMSSKYFNGVDKGAAVDAFNLCLRRTIGNSSELGVIGLQLKSAARPGIGSAKQVGLWVLALSGLMYAL